MANLRALDFRLLDSIFDMDTGYVLNFSDRTMAQFFAEELNIDIDDPAYKEDGTSKAKRLRCFLKKADAPTAVRTLNALWKYREMIRQQAGRQETLPNAYDLLLEVINRIQGRPSSQPTLVVPGSDRVKQGLPHADHVRLPDIQAELQQAFSAALGLNPVKNSSPPELAPQQPESLSTAVLPGGPSHAFEPNSATHVRSPSSRLRDQVFVSYSHKDSKWLERLEKHLKPRIRNGKLDIWSDKRIKPGAEWRKEIDEALARAKVAVLLVSPDFLASDFITRNELPPLLAATKQGGATILWVPVSAAAYKEVGLDVYQAVLDPAKPLKKRHHANVDEAMEEICNVISQAFSG